MTWYDLTQPVLSGFKHLFIMLSAIGGPGHYPPMVRRQVAPEAKKGGGGAHFNRAHNPEAIARAKGGGGTGVAPGGKSSFAGQIVPIYGFGILLYIMYILFKVRHRKLATVGNKIV